MPEAPLHLIRPEVRAERAYRVPTDAAAPAKLDQNERPLDLPAELKRTLVERFAEVEWNRYPDDRPHALIAALSERLGHPADGIIVGHGSNELCHTLGLAMMGRDVPVVLPHPMFALFESVARMHAASIVPVPPTEPFFGHAPEAILEAAVDSKAALTVVTTPNNPTGQTLPFDGLKRIVAGAPGFVLIDEAYVEFVDGPTAESLLREYRNVLVMRTFSKAMGLAGLRVAYLLGAPVVIQEIEKARLPFLVDRASEAIALAVLQHPDLVEEAVRLLVAERERVLATLGERPAVEALPSDANFFLMRTPLPTPELCTAIAEHGVRIRDVSGYRALAASEGASGWARVSIGTPAQNQRFLDALDRVLTDNGE